MKHIIFAVHGIRTYGNWHRQLEKAINDEAASLFSAGDQIEFISYNYGFFGFPSFIYPPARRAAINAFKNVLLAHWSSDQPVTIDIFAHSFGTYLVLHALASNEMPPGFRVRNVVFSGSALPPDAYNKGFSIVRARIGRLINDCGTKDLALLATLPVYGTGMAGRLGLHGPRGNQFTNRFFSLGHSGYFAKSPADPESHFRKYWVPLLRSDFVLDFVDERTEPPGFLDRIVRTLGEHGGRAALGLYFAALSGIVVALTVLWQDAVRSEQRAVLERNQTLLSQSKFLTDYSKSEHAKGDVATSMLLALEALPDRKSPSALQRERPYWKEAAFTLGKAIASNRERRVLSIGDDQIIDLRFSRDGSRLAVTHRPISGALDKYRVRLWDVATGRELAVRHAFAFEFSPDGATLAIALRDNTVSLLNTANGVERVTLEGHTGRVWWLAFSPDGQTVVTSSNDKTVRFWEAANGRPGAVMPDQGDYVRLQFSPDGKMLLISTSETVRVVDAATRVERLALEMEHSASLYFSPDSSLLAVQEEEDLKLFDLAERKWSRDISISDKDKSTARFSPDSKIIATGSTEGIGPDYFDIFLWNARTGSSEGVLKSPGRPKSIEFSPDGRLLAASYTDNKVRLWRLEGREAYAELDEQESVRFSTDGRLVATHAGATARLWDATTGKEVAVLAGHHSPILGAQFSSADNELATYSADKTIRLWRKQPEFGPAVVELQARLGEPSVLSPDRRTHAYIGDNSSSILLWDTASQSNRKVLDHSHRVDDVSFSPDSKVIATSLGDEKAVRVWDAASGSPRFTLKEQGEYVKTGGVPIGHIIVTAFSPDGKSIAAASADRAVRIWDVVTGTELAQYRDATARVTDIRFSQDGMTLITVTEDKAIRVWDVANTKRPRAVIEKTFDVLVFSPDGKRIAVGAQDGTVDLWNVATATPYASLRHSEAKIAEVSFSPDGGTLVSLSSDHEMQFWDVESGKTTSKFGHRDGEVLEVGFLTGSKIAIVVYKGRIIRLWDTSSDELKAALTEVQQVLVSPDGQFVAVITGAGRRLGLWNLNSEHERIKLEGASTLMFSPDSRLIAAGTRDGTWRFWDTKTGRELTTISGNPGHVNFFALSPTGKSLAISFNHGSIRLIDVTTRTEYATLPDHLSSITSIRFAADEAALTVVSDNVDVGDGLQLVGKRRLHRWHLFNDVQAQVDHAKSIAPRCLTATQRQNFHLSAPQPSWCFRPDAARIVQP